MMRCIEDRQSISKKSVFSFCVTWNEQLGEKNGAVNKPRQVLMSQPYGGLTK